MAKNYEGRHPSSGICLYDADEDYTLMPDEKITLRLMLRYIQMEDL